MYNKNNFAVGKVASKSTIKPELGCIAFYGDRTVATDSFRLIEMSATGKKLDTPILYEADVIKKGVKLKKGETITMMKEIPVKASPWHGDTYPQIDVVLKDLERTEYVEHFIQAEYLEEILNVMKNVDARYGKVTLKVPKEQGKPIVIVAVNTEEGKETQTARALVMPWGKGR